MFAGWMANWLYTVKLFYNVGYCDRYQTTNKGRSLIKQAVCMKGP